MKVILYGWLVAVMMVAGATKIFAQGQSPGTDLTTASLEDLMNIEVTSVSKKEEKLFQTAAAIYVITQEDIRRSGLSSIPELLRLAPGLQVARIDGNKWAITARGFNSRFSNKLLVLVDGRSIYSPETSGVFWEAQDLPLDEIERIEIIRGPGGTIWGANAVNGVINIITKNAQDTQGGLVASGGGSEDQGFTDARYGAKIGNNAHYRIFARYFNRGGQVNAAGFNVHDWQYGVSGGFRIDWKKSNRDALALHGDIYDSSLKETSVNRSPARPFVSPPVTPGEFTGGNVLGRWNHIFSDRSNTTMQIYFDRARREVYDIGERFDTFDVDLQHHIIFGRQDLIGGLGYRLVVDQNNSNSGSPVRYIPKGRSIQIFSGFVQDELSLIKNRLRLTLGAKLEHSDQTGYELQPNARLLWTPSTRQTLWAAISRAVRTPSRGDRDLRVNITAFPGPRGLPIILTLLGNPNSKSEELRAYEFGYRVQPSKKLSFDIATFYNFYDRLQTVEAEPPALEFDPQPTHLISPIRFNSLSRGDTYGIEVSGNWDLSSRLKLHGSYSFLREQIHLYPQSGDRLPGVFENQNPRHQFQIQSRLRLPHNFESDSALYYVSSLPGVSIPDYTRIDTRLGWKMRESIELSLGLQNLLDDRHPEFASPIIGVVPSQARRSIYGKATWRF